MSDNGADAPAPAGRPRLNLKPRDPSAAAKLAEERDASAKPSPFGAAKPREAILAARTGKKEEDILKEDASKERLHLRLDKDQRIALEEAEAAVDEAKADLKAAEGEDGAPAAAAAAVKVGEAQAKLASLEEAFTADALAKAKDGNAPRPSERRRALDEAEYGGEGRGYGGEGRGDRGGDRGGDRRGGDRDRGGDRGGGGGGDSQEYANFGGRAGAGGGGNFNQDRY